MRERERERERGFQFHHFVRVWLHTIRGGATARLGPPKILKYYFILCISIEKFKYLAIKIEVGPPKCLS